MDRHRVGGDIQDTGQDCYLAILSLFSVGFSAENVDLISLESQLCEDRQVAVGAIGRLDYHLCLCVCACACDEN